MHRDAHQEALRAAARVALSVSILGCGGATTTDPPPAPAPASSTTDGPATGDKQGSAAPAPGCEAVIAGAFPTEGTHPGVAQNVTADVKTCCERQLDATKGQMAHRWDCCANVDQSKESVQMACTPWGPPVPPSIAYRGRRPRRAA